MSQANPNNTRFFVLLALLVGGLLLWLVMSGDKYSWQEEYAIENKNPYDLWLFRQLVERSAGDRLKPINDSLEYRLSLSDYPDSSVYMLAGGNAYYDSSEVAALITFAKKGGKVFIASRYQSYRLMEMLFEVESGDTMNYYEYWYEPAIYTDVYRAERGYLRVYSATEVAVGFEIKKLYENEVVNGRWAYFQPEYVAGDGLGILPLGAMNDSLINYIRISAGEGAFYLHTCPMAFSNYFLKGEDALAYANACLSHIGPYKTLYWDEYSTVYKDKAQTSGDVGQQAKGQDGPLSFILMQKPLRWSWFVLLIGSALFLLAGLRRKQRAIPLILPRGNSSLLFAETLSDMYKLGDDHSRICQLKWKMFQNTIRRNYGISIQYKDEADKKNIVSRLAIRSGLEEPAVDAIFTAHLKTMVSERVNHELLTEFHNRLQHFYKHAK